MDPKKIAPPSEQNPEKVQLDLKLKQTTVRGVTVKTGIKAGQVNPL